MGDYTVYIHTLPNGKKYVGITKQKEEKRWLNGTGYQKQNKFYKEIQEYGWRNIQHEIVASELTEKDAKQLEKEYISKFEANTDKGCNVIGDKNKDDLILIRCTKEEKQEIKRDAEKHEKSVSEYLRYLVAKERKEMEGEK